MPGPQSDPKGGKSKAVHSPRPAYRGKESHSLDNDPPKALRKRLTKLARRRAVYEGTVASKSGYRKPGSMNLRKG